MSQGRVITVKSQREWLEPEFIAETLGFSLLQAEAYRHPGSTEREIIDYVLHNYSFPSETVFDPLCGIGTIVKRAIQLNRNAIGSDVVPEYVLLANASIKRATRVDNRIWNHSAVELDSANWLFEYRPIKLCFFSPPLMNIERGSYPDSRQQIGNYKTGQEDLWVQDLASVMRSVIKILCNESGYLAINWSNQICNGYVVPLVAWGISSAIELGYTLVDERVIIFSSSKSRLEFLHVFRPKRL